MGDMEDDGKNRIKKTLTIPYSSYEGLFKRAVESSEANIYTLDTYGVSKYLIPGLKEIERPDIAFVHQKSRIKGKIDDPIVITKRRDYVYAYIHGRCNFNVACPAHYFFRLKQRPDPKDENVSKLEPSSFKSFKKYLKV